VVLEEVTMSSKNQIVVPKGARKALKLKPGDRISVVVMDTTVVLQRKPADPVKALRGAARGLRYPTDYLARERADW
jgi:AbrB family looped-hinge helix DNA binding protein